MPAPTPRTTRAAAGAAALAAVAVLAATPAAAALERGSRTTVPAVHLQAAPQHRVPGQPRPERAAIEDAVRTSPLTAGVDGSRYAVTDVRTASGDPAWAAAALAPTGADLEPAVVLLQQVDGIWQVADLGTVEVGCGIAPAPVLADLALPCPA